MAIRTGGGAVVARHDSAAMNAKLVGFDGMGKRNVVFREKIGIGVARTASGGEILLRDGRGWVLRRADLVGRTVAGLASGTLPVAILRCDPMDAGGKRLHFR